MTTVSKQHTLTSACRAILVNASSIILWCKWQSIDEEEQGGWKDLLTEGMAPSVSVFLVSKALWRPPQQPLILALLPDNRSMH